MEGARQGSSPDDLVEGLFGPGGGWSLVCERVDNESSPVNRWEIMMAYLGRLG
jgi:hypothetical protein